MAITDLTGTYWIIDKLPKYGNGQVPCLGSKSITFINDNETYYGLLQTQEAYYEVVLNYKTSPSSSNYIKVFDGRQYDGWDDTVYYDIYITGGTDVTNSDLISFLETYATKGTQIDYLTTDRELNSVANAIRTKGGTSTQLTYPFGFVTAIQNIPTGGSPTLQSKTVTPSGATQTITADSGYDGLDTVTVNPITLKMGVLLPAAELVQTYSYDKYIVEDEGVTIPAYSTSTKTLKASASLTTVNLYLANNDYYVLERFLTIPTYNTTTKQKGRPVYQIYTMAYEITSTPGNTFKDGSTSYASRLTSVTTAGGAGRYIYWVSGTNISTVNTNSYGVYQTATAPTISSASSTTPTLTLKSPTLQIRGHASYFTSAVWSTLTDIRYQYKIEVYRIIKSTYNLDGWNLTTQLDRLIECADSSSHKLT